MKTFAEYLEDWDWQSALGCEGQTYGNTEPPRFDLKTDVAEVVAAVDGEPDGDEWLMVGRLNDGSFFFLVAGCDYTGWSCQASNTWRYAETLEAMKLEIALDEKRRLWPNETP